MVSKYPAELDGDAEISRVDDNVSEIGSQAINGIREAIFNIQRALGTNPQGAAADLRTRLSQSLNEDGTIKTAALIISGINNAQISPTAAISESKLDLDVPTQDLQDAITSNDVDIAALQEALADLILKVNLHIAGTQYKHDSYDILLDGDSPSSTPVAFIELSSVNVGSALIEINNRFIDHANPNKIGAHTASNVSVDSSNFKIMDDSVDDVQKAIEALERLREVELIEHRDNLHSNGILNWSNEIDGYNVQVQKYPSTYGEFASAILVSGTVNKLRIPGIDFENSNVGQGDVVVLYDSEAAGQYFIDDVGPRAAYGSRPALTSEELEITGAFTDGVFDVDGYVNAQIYEGSSTWNLKGSLATTILPSSIGMDSVLLSRPNAARVVSLGIRPDLIDGTETLDIEVGVGNGVRSISVSGLNQDRSGIVSTVTLDTIVDRLNSQFIGSANFPVSAYKLGNELMLSHNWDQERSYYISVKSSGTGNTVLGFDGYGADVVEQLVRPTRKATVYVDGEQHRYCASIFNDVGSAAGTTISLSSNPIAAGVKIGQVAHIREHATVEENGTYFITNVTSNSIEVNSSISSGNVIVEVAHDTVPLHALSNSGDSLIVESFVDKNLHAGFNVRSSYDKSISNLDIVGITNNFVSGEYELISSVTDGGYDLKIGSLGYPTFIPTGFVGEKKVYSEANVEFIIVYISGVLSAGSAELIVHEHISEETSLELCTVRTNGLETLFNVSDLRMFGTLGLDELREDVVQLYVETPISELRNDGIIRGFDVLDSSYVDVAYQSNQSVLIRGGEAYINGVRVEVRTQPVVFPNVAGTYYVCLDSLATYHLVNDAEFSYEDILSGHVGNKIAITKVEHDGYSISSATDLRFFISNIDYRSDAIVDTTNHFVGNFGSVDAAIAYVNAFPNTEKHLIKIVSRKSDTFFVPPSSKYLHIEIDGYVGSVGVQSSCKISAKGRAAREEAHILGNVAVFSTTASVELENLIIASGVACSTSGTTLADIKMSGCNVSGSCTIRGNESIFVNDCTFTGSVTFTGNNGLVENYSHIQISNSQFVSSGSSLQFGTGNYIVIDGTKFDNARIISTETLLKFSNCVFENLSDNQHMLVEYFYAENCLFQNLTIDEAGSIIFVTGDGVLNNCHFKNISISNQGQVVNYSDNSDTYMTIKNCVFQGITWPSDIAITSSEFTGNSAIGSTGDSRIKFRDKFCDNVGFTSVVNSGSGDSIIKKIISNNTFTASTVFGSNIDMSLSTHTYSEQSQIIISDNIFTLAENHSGIVVPSYAINTIISNNSFKGSGTATSIGVNFGSSATTERNFKIENNIFQDCAGVVSTGSVYSASVVDNLFDSSNGVISFSFHPGQNSIFSNNYIGNVKIIFAGTNWENGSCSDNILADGVLHISGAVSNNSFCNNAGDGYFDISASIDNSLISGNKADFICSANCTFEKIGFVSNFGQLSASGGSITWKESLISENFFNNETPVVFNLHSNIANERSNVIIDGNAFLNGAKLTAVNEIDFVSFSANINLSDPSNTDERVSLIVDKHINNSLITSNFNFAIRIADGSDSSIISLNNLKSASSDLSLNNINLLGDVNGTTVDGNICESIYLNCNSVSGLSVKNNTLFDSLFIFSEQENNFSLSEFTFSANSVVNDISIGTGMTDGYSFTMKDGIMNGNTCNDLNVYPVGSDETTGFSDSEYILSGVIFSANRCSNLNLLSYEDYFPASSTTISDITISNNVVDNINVMGGPGSFLETPPYVVAGSGSIAYEKLVINGNSIKEGLNILENIEVYSCTINGNILDNLICIMRPISESDFFAALKDITISNNVITSLVNFTDGYYLIDTDIIVENFSFANNIANNADVQFAITSNSVSPTRTVFRQSYFVGNSMRSLTFTNSNSGNYIDLDGIMISSNTFSNSLDGTGIQVLYGANTPGDADLQRVHISNNNTPFIKIYDASGELNVDELAITSNLLNTITSGTIEIDLCDGDKITISDNVLSSILIKSSGDESFPELANVVISGNSLELLKFSNQTLEKATISNNTLDDIEFDAALFSGDLSKVSFVGNYLSGDFIFPSHNDIFSGSITDCIFIGNIAGRFILPHQTKFTATNLIAFNQATSQWTSADSISTDGTSNIFPFGNVGTFASSVNFGGSTQRTVTNSNGTTITS